MILSLFRSAKGNWVNRLNKLLDMQLKIARDGLSENERSADRSAFAEALDTMADQINNYEDLLKDVALAYVKFDIKTSKPIHKLGLTKPQKLSENEKIRMFDEMSLIMNNLKRLSPQMFALKQTGGFGFLLISIGMVCFPETREKGFKLWSYLKDCFPLCREFKYKKHIPLELIKILDAHEIIKI